MYCRMSFHKVNSRNQTIIDLAKKMGRTPASLSMKMGNLAWHDPKNPSSLRRGSKLDETIWNEFFAQPENLIFESEQAHAFFQEGSLEAQENSFDGVAKIPDGLDCRKLTNTRINQIFFRRTVLAAYQERCCITDLGASALLNASHIIPWRENRERTNPSNGLCLNVLHDRAFDRGLITVLPDGVVLVSAALKRDASTCKEFAFVLGCDGTKIQMPDKFTPRKEFLEYHNCEIFVGR